LTDPGPAVPAQSVRVDARPSVSAALQQAAARDPRLRPAVVAAAVQAVIAAWVMAADGDASALAGITSPQVAAWLISPATERWAVGPGPRVTRIELTGYEPGDKPRPDEPGDEPRLDVRLEFDGSQRFSGDEESRPPVETSFVARLELALARAAPWRVISGHVWTLDGYLGYAFTRRRERPGEYRERTGSLASDAAIGPTGRYRLLARFAEHDERFAAWAEIEVARAVPPTRSEAEELIWPAVDAETSRALGPGDWRPVLLYMDLIELVGEEPDSGSP
jgi:hypothetical protein